jgi:sterol 14-demethylase
VPAPGEAVAEVTVRIVVDRDLCQGHGVCEGEAPNVFEVSKAGELTVLDERPAGDRRAIEAAVKYCPTHALRIVEEP